jgi:hypothetical protein
MSLPSSGDSSLGDGPEDDDETAEVAGDLVPGVFADEEEAFDDEDFDDDFDEDFDNELDPEYDELDEELEDDLSADDAGDGDEAGEPGEGDFDDDF